MIKGVLVVLGCASLSAACVGSAEDEGSAPVSERAAANQAAQVKTEAAAPVVAAGFAVASIFAPRASRLTAGVFATVAVADFLQVGYKAGQRAL